jgi:hypothetical protein
MVQYFPICRSTAGHAGAQSKLSQSRARDKKKPPIQPATLNHTSQTLSLPRALFSPFPFIRQFSIASAFDFPTSGPDYRQTVRASICADSGNANVGGDQDLLNSFFSCRWRRTLPAQDRPERESEVISFFCPCREGEDHEIDQDNHPSMWTWTYEDLLSAELNLQ